MTAVEFLEEQIIRFHNWKLNQVYDENCFDEIELKKAIQKAKEIEKQQTIDFADDLLAQNDINYIAMPDLAEQYYNETFKK